MKTLYLQIKRRREADGLSTNAGFTLIELLIVIVVLGILAGVVIFALGGVTGKSALAACQADGATVSTAMSAWSAQNPAGTVTQTDLVGSNNGLQSWPSNPPHYIFAIAVGSDFYYTSGNAVIAAPAGTLMVATTPAGNVTSTPGTSTAAGNYLPYTGPSSCSGVQ